MSKDDARCAKTLFHITMIINRTLSNTTCNMSCNMNAAKSFIATWPITTKQFTTNLRAAQKNPAESTGSSSRGVDEPKANAGRGAERAARCRSNRSVRSRSRCSNASRRDIDASHIARLRSSTCNKTN